jgi:hypothetical protein
MVKRILRLVLPMVCLAAPLAAQDYAQLELGFGYANWGTDTSPTTTDRVHGFAMHTDYNLTSWLAIDNYLGAYSFPSFGTTFDFTAIYNVFGIKLTARDLLDDRVSPFVVAGFGGGTVSDRGVGFSSSAARYGGGVDINLNDGFAFRVDASSLAVGQNFVTSAWSSNFNLATSVIFKLGF